MNTPQPVVPNRRAILRHLAWLFAGVPDDQFVTICHAGAMTGASFSVRDHESQATFAQRRVNSYYRTSAVFEMPDHAGGHRGGEAITSFIPGFFADLDFGTEGHAGKNYPETLTRTISLLCRCDVEPSLLVHTGGGLHSAWKYVEPIDVRDPAVRQAVKARHVHIQAALVATWKEHGYHLDSVADFARLLRPVSSTRQKGDSPGQLCWPIETTLLDGRKRSELRTSIDDLEAWANTVIGPAQKSGRTIVIPPDAIIRPIHGRYRWNPDGIVKQLAEASEGERNSTLNWAVWTIRRDIETGKASADDARGALARLAEVAVMIGLGDREIVATMKSTLGGDRRVA